LPPVLSELIVAHAGNPKDGLCSVWIGAPVLGPDDAIRWAWLHQIYSIASAEAEVEDLFPSTSGGVQAFDSQPKPVLTFERRPEMTEDEAGERDQ
jgi:hypothetical protein